MIVYSITTIITVLLIHQAYLVRNSNKRVRNFWKIVSAIPFILISGFRYDVGQDYFYTYVPYFKMASNGYFKEGIEIGFEYLTRTILIFSSDYLWLFVICAVIFFYLIFSSIYEYSPDWVMSAFLLVGAGYLFSFFNIMRQMMAVAFVLYSFKYIKSRRFLFFLICIGLAALFHISALVCLPIYFFYGLKIEARKGLFIAGISFLFSGYIIQGIVEVVKLTKYYAYFGSIFDTGNKGYVTIALTFSVLLFSYCYVSRVKNKEERAFVDFLLILKLIAFILSFYDGNIPLLARIKFYFDLPTIILVPIIVKNIRMKNKRIVIKMLIYSLFTFYFIYTIGIKNSNNVLPYITIFGR